MGEDTTDRGDTEVDAPRVFEEDGEFLLAHGGILLPEIANGQDIGMTPGALLDPMGTMGAVQKTTGALGLEAGLPAVEGGPAGADVATGQTHIAAVRVMPGEHVMAHPGGRGQSRERNGLDTPVPGLRLSDRDVMSMRIEAGHDCLRGSRLWHARPPWTWGGVRTPHGTDASLLRGARSGVPLRATPYPWTVNCNGSL